MQEKKYKNHKQQLFRPSSVSSLFYSSFYRNWNDSVLDLFRRIIIYCDTEDSGSHLSYIPIGKECLLHIKNNEKFLIKITNDAMQ